MQIKGRDYQVLYTKESKEVQVAIDLLSMVEHKSLTVEYKERKAFLTPFIPLLINPQKELGLKGVSPFANCFTSIELYHKGTVGCHLIDLEL